jgi:hypothetical protein
VQHLSACFIQARGGGNHIDLKVQAGESFEVTIE